VGQDLEATVNEVDDFSGHSVSQPFVSHDEEIECDLAVQRPNLQDYEFHVEDRVHALNFLSETHQIDFCKPTLKTLTFSLGSLCC
jgi:hypothetical protein